MYCSSSACSALSTTASLLVGQITLKDKIRYSQWFPQGEQQPHPIRQRHLLSPFYFLGGVGGAGGSLTQLSPTQVFTVLSHREHCGARDVVPLILHLGISLMSNSLVPAPVVTARSWLSVHVDTTRSSVSALLSNPL